MFESIDILLNIVGNALNILSYVFPFYIIIKYYAIVIILKDDASVLIYFEYHSMNQNKNQIL
jgi:hypothetical protein